MIWRLAIAALAGAGAVRTLDLITGDESAPWSPLQLITVALVALVALQVMRAAR